MTYFKPWRRRLGVVTLLTACVLMAGWVRSLAAREYAFFLCDNDTTNRLVSFNGTIYWERLRQDGIKRLTRAQFSDAETNLEFDETRRFVWKWTYLGFGRGEYTSGRLELFKSANPDLPFENLTQSVWFIPYWSIVIPLTLLSAWLLLSKPKRSISITAPAL